MMRRRHVVSLLAASPLAAALPVAAQPSGRVKRIGVLSWYAVGDTGRYVPLIQELRALGYVEDRDVAFEYRWAEGDSTWAARFAAELVRSQVDVIVAIASPAAFAAREATRTIPIVSAASDPLDIGLVTNLARPGGNLTGVSMVVTDIAAKWLELLQEIMPGLDRVAFLGSTRNPTTRDIVGQLEAAAARLGIAAQLLLVDTPAEIEAAFAAAAAGHAGAVIVQPILVSSRAAIAGHALHHRLPWIGDSREYAEAGAVLAYGADRPALLRRAAIQVDRILRGADPGDIPIEQPTTFLLLVNLRAARALGLPMPPSILVRADEVIE